MNNRPIIAMLYLTQHAIIIGRLSINFNHYKKSFIYYDFVNYQFKYMSFLSQFEAFRDNARIVFNDRFMGDDGAKELAKFLSEHKKVQSLEIKSNDISADGFVQIFEALKKNNGIRQLILEYNNLGQNQYEDWQNALGQLIDKSPKFERLNISNNKVSSEAFRRLVPFLCSSKTLKLVEIRYNNINSSDIDYFVSELKSSKNEALLYVQLSGNKIRKETIDALQNVLKANRNKNPISKDKLLMTGGAGFGERTEGSIVGNVNTFYLNKTNAIDDLSKQNVIKHLEDILDQNRKDTTEMKVRLERELDELQKRQKNDAREMNELDNRCNELMIQNRNLKFELERTLGQHQQLERDQQHHLRLHQQKLREANKQLQQLQKKYEDIEERMYKEHDLKMKEISRDWESRMRIVEEKIRTAENENNNIEAQIRRNLEKRQRLRVEYVEEENIIRSRVEEEEAQRYGFKIAALQSKLREVEESREKFLRRNQDLIYQLEKTQANNTKEILNLEQELSSLKSKEQEFLQKNKDFLFRNQKLKSDIKLKQITIQKLQEEVNQLNEEIELKKSYNREQVDKIAKDSAYARNQKQEEKRSQIEKLNQLQATLRHSQLQNAKLRQQYGILAQKLQVGLGRSVQQVFTENSLY